MHRDTDTPHTRLNMSKQTKQSSLLGFMSPNCSNSDTNARSSADTLTVTSDTDCSESAHQVKKARKSPDCHYLRKWESEFLWLRQASSSDGMILMFCRACEKAGMTNTFTKGCRTYQRNALVRHSVLADHRLAISSQTLSKTLQKHVEKKAEQDSSSKIVMLRTVYGMAKEEMPERKFSFLMKLQEINGVPALQGGKYYTHHESVNDLQKAIADTLTEKLLNDVNNSPFVGVVIDETVNVTIDKKLIVYLRILVDGKPKSVFIANTTVKSGDAETITKALLDVFTSKGIDFSKVVGLGSDGASVMTGRLNGVGVKLKRLNPFLVHVHCCAHRVALAASDSAKNVTNVSAYKRTVNTIYNYFEYSAARYGRLRELNKVLNDDDLVSLKQPCSTRWLSLNKAVKAIHQNWPALCMQLEEDSVNGNATANGLQKAVSRYSFIAMTCFLKDALPIMDRLSLTFQKDDVILSTIQPMIESTSTELYSLIDNVGETERDFRESINNDGKYKGQCPKYVDQNAHTTVREGFLRNLISTLEARFPVDQLNVLTGLDVVLNPGHYPADDTIRQHGVRELELVGDNFTQILDADKLKAEFGQVKVTLRASGSTSMSTACRLLITDYDMIFPEFSKLAAIALVIPVTSVPAERGFSCQNRIKDKHRNKLTEDHVQRLMLISMEGPDSYEKFDFDNALRKFDASKKRRL